MPSMASQCLSHSLPGSEISWEGQAARTTDNAAGQAGQGENIWKCCQSTTWDKSDENIRKLSSWSPSSGWIMWIWLHYTLVQATSAPLPLLHCPSNSCQSDWFQPRCLPKMSLPLISQECRSSDTNESHQIPGVHISAPVHISHWMEICQHGSCDKTGKLRADSVHSTVL